MSGVIGELLPLALVVAISPLPIIGAILMLFSPHPRANGLVFLLGWTGAILVITVVFTLLSGLIPKSSGGSDPVVGIIKIALGVLLVLVAIRQWGARPRDGAPSPTPRWMTATDSISPVGALGLGALLAGPNPKNLVVGIAAGVTIGTASIDGALTVIAVAIFVVTASLSIAIPVIAYVVAAPAVRPLLRRMREWLLAYNTIVIAAVLLVIGVVVIGEGIAEF